MIAELFAHPQVERLGWVLLHACWQGALVAFVLRAVLDALDDRSAELRYAACLGALVLLLALPVVTWWVMDPGAGSTAAQRAVPEEVLRQSPPAWAAVVAGTAVQQALPVKRPEPQPWWLAMQHRLRPLLPYMVIAWMLGVLAFSLRMLGGWMQVQRMRRTGLRAVPERWSERFEMLVRRLGIARRVRLWASTHVDVPLTVGVLRPVVLVPVGFLTGLPPEQVEAVLAHELAHVRRYDYFVNLLQGVVETLLFFHPAAWWISRQLRAEREFACDDLAVAACRDRLVYARALTGVAARHRSGPWMAPAASDGSLSRRIHRLVAPDNAAEVPWGRVVVAGGALLVTIALVVGACAPRPVQDVQAAERDEAPGVVLDDQGETERQPALYRVTSTRGDVARPEMFVVRADTDSVEVRVERMRGQADRRPGEHAEIIVRMRGEADSLRGTVERRLQREMDREHRTVFRFRADSLEREAARLARWHVDSLREAGFFARFDTLHLPDVDVRAFTGLDTLHASDFDFDFDFDHDFDVDSDRFDALHLYLADSLALRFDSLFALHDPGTFMLRLDSLDDEALVWQEDSLRVFFRDYDEQMRDWQGRQNEWQDQVRTWQDRQHEWQKKLQKELRAQQPEHLREQAEQLEREADRLRQRAEEMERDQR